MSTKTTFKRIALVAVAALGFGLLSVAPSSAADAVASKVTSIALSASTTTPTVGASSTVSVTPTTTAVAANDDAYNFKGFVLSKPAGSVVGLTATAGAVVKTITPAIVGSTSNLSVFQAPVTTAATGVGAWLLGTIAVSSDTAGAVTLRVFNDGATMNSLLDPAEAYQDIVITFGAASAAAANQFPASNSTTASTNGTLNGVRVSSVGVVVTQSSGRVGTQVAFKPAYLLTRNGGASNSDAGASNATKYGTVAYSVTNPAGTAVTVYSAQGGTTASASQAIAGSTTPIALGADGTVAVAQSVSATTGYPQLGSAVYFSAATAGAYTITAFHDANLDGLVSVGEAITSSTVTVAADALPAISFTTYGQSTPAQGADNGIGQLVKISLKNGTLPASLGASEVLTITGPTSTVIDKVSTLGANTKLSMGDSTNGVSVALTQANFDGNGNAYINVGNSTAGGGTYTLTAVVTGGTAAGASASGTFTVADTTTYPVATTSATFGANAVTNPGNLLGVKGATLASIAAGGASGAATWAVNRGVATTVSAKMTVGAIASKSYTATYTDTLGLVTGLVGGQYKLVKSTGATVTTTTSVSFSVAVPALTSTQTNIGTLAIDVLEATGDATDTQTITITQELAAATFSYTNPAQDAATYTIRAAVASANKFTAVVTDQFGNALPNVSVNAAIAGRNATTVIPTMLTNASGEVSYTLTDVYTGTLLLTDTLTFTPAAGATSSVTVNYATYLPAASIKVTTPDSATATATGIAGTVTSDINAGASGASATTATVSVVVKDANGGTLPAGVPVTFTVKGDGAAILSTAVSTVTAADGSASTSVYAWKNVDAVVTATAGTISATGTVYFRQADAVAGVQAEARTITAKADGNVVTATVTDRYGNPIKGVNVVATRVGSGTFNGTSSLTGTTNKLGQVDFVLSNGTADVTVSFETTSFGQSAATKGYVDAGVTAITASAAGTITTAETGVGASFDAAGVNSATVNVSDSSVQSAADAAAEATDAANAATDAANAAAEAADAATAAAQDAADAVAALSTQVSEMINALKKQITALTNLVIKIQKKVKA